MEYLKMEMHNTTAKFNFVNGLLCHHTSYCIQNIITTCILRKWKAWYWSDLKQHNGLTKSCDNQFTDSKVELDWMIISEAYFSFLFNERKVDYKSKIWGFHGCDYEDSGTLNMESACSSKDHSLILEFLWSILWLPNAELPRYKGFLCKKLRFLQSQQNSCKDNIKFSGI